MSLLLYRTTEGPWVKTADGTFRLAVGWEHLCEAGHIQAALDDALKSATEQPLPDEILLPVTNEEVWAAGVTYYRSRFSLRSGDQVRIDIESIGTLVNPIG